MTANTAPQTYSDEHDNLPKRGRHGGEENQKAQPQGRAYERRCKEKFTCSVLTEKERNRSLRVHIRLQRLRRSNSCRGSCGQTSGQLQYPILLPSFVGPGQQQGTFSGHLREISCSDFSRAGAMVVRTGTPGLAMLDGCSGNWPCADGSAANENSVQGPTMTAEWQKLVA